MTLLRAVRGWAAPLRQASRSHDGVKGMFACRPFKKGDLLLSIPIRSCFFPHISLNDDSRVLQRWNSHVHIFPEITRWLRQLSPTTKKDPVCLKASVSIEETTVSAAPSSVLTLSLSAVEAALAICVALRAFFGMAIPVNRQYLIERNEGPPLSRAADLYIASLPIQKFLSEGVESVYDGALDSSADTHTCLEQIAWNLRDAVLGSCSDLEYRYYDENPSTLDSVILAALYIVRSRVLYAPLISGPNVHTDRTTSVIAPCIDLLNHEDEPLCTAATCISLPHGVVVVRATRDIRVWEEITINYYSEKAKHHFSSTCKATDASMMWAPRYLISE